MHRLGNLFGLFSAHVELLDRGGEPAARRLKPHQLERLHQANGQYHEVSSLLGLLARSEAVETEFCAGSLLNTLHGTLVSERDGERIPIQLEREARIWTRGDASLFLTAVLLANQALVEQAPSALRGSLTWQLERKDERGELCIDFALDPSQLPFRLEGAELDTNMTQTLAQAGYTCSASDEGLGIIVAFCAQDAPSLS